MEGGAAYNLIKVVMGALKKHGGVSDVDVSRKLMSFRNDGVNVFQGVRKGLTRQMGKCKLRWLIFCDLTDFRQSVIYSNATNTL
jgi:hypothetical protein